MRRLVILFLAFSNAALAAKTPVTLKQVQVTSGSQVDLLFDGRITRAQIKTEFFNDIIQVSLTDASVYPAKISSVSGGKLVKVFAYQYAPKLVRCRLTVSEPAEGFKGTIKVEPSGKILTIRLDGAIASRAETKKDKLAYTASARAVPGGADDGSPAAKAADAEESALLARVMAADESGAKPGPKVEPKPEAKAAASEPRQEAKADSRTDPRAETKPAPAAEPETKSEPAKAATMLAASVEAPSLAADSDFENKPVSSAAAKPLGGGKPLPSPLGAFAKLIAVIAIFVGAAFGARKFLQRGGRTGERGLLGAIGRFTSGKLGAKGKLIEVVSTHHLGPKKSIAVVKVAGRTLVLGVTNDSINLISQIGGGDSFGDTVDAFESDAEPALGGGLGASAAGPAVFSDLLATETALPRAATRPAPAAPRPNPAPASPRFSPAAYAPAVAQPAQPAAPARQPLAPLAHQAYGAVAGATPAAAAASASDGGGVRDRIRSRLEGLKQL
jgi:flagellar biogenesis protein FliO